MAWLNPGVKIKPSPFNSKATVNFDLITAQIICIAATVNFAFICIGSHCELCLICIFSHCELCLICISSHCELCLLSPNVIKTQRRRLYEPSFNLRMTLDVKYIQGRLAKRYCEKSIKCNKVLARIIQTKRLSFK